MSCETTRGYDMTRLRVTSTGYYHAVFGRTTGYNTAIGKGLTAWFAAFRQKHQQNINNRMLRLWHIFPSMVIA